VLLGFPRFVNSPSITPQSLHLIRRKVQWF